MIRGAPTEGPLSGPRIFYPRAPLRLPDHQLADDQETPSEGTRPVETSAESRPAFSSSLNNSYDELGKTRVGEQFNRKPIYNAGRLGYLFIQKLTCRKHSILCVIPL